MIRSAPQELPEDDIDDLYALFVALCVSGSPPVQATAEVAVGLLSEIDAALFEEADDEDSDDEDSDDDSDDDDDDDDSDDGGSDDDDGSDDDRPALSDAELEERAGFVSVVCDLIRAGGDVKKVVKQARDIEVSFQAIFLSQ